MTPRFRLIVLIALLASPSAFARQQAQPPPDAQPEQRPRFRGGANLVRVDAYVTADGAPVTDLTVQDFEVLEDNVPQRVESFELVRPRGPGPQDERREPNTVAEAREMAADADARVFVLFMDIWHVQLEGSYRAQGPITRLLNRVIGQDDLVGIMTPEMSARNLTLARRTTTIEGILKDSWYWGQRNQLNTVDPREREIEFCYPDVGETKGIAAEMIARRRAGKTLDAIGDLIIHLEGIREERKFVVLLSEGWLLHRPDQGLSRPVKGPDGERRAPGGPIPIGTDPQGRLRMDPDRGSGSYDSCERERSMLAFTDHETEFQQLLQRANRANVSFYPLDARGLVPFDEPIGPKEPPLPSVDAARLRARHEALRTLAVQTDGYAIVDTGLIDKALERMVQDTRSYYLLGYYSTNTKLDGRFRRLTVRVKRPRVEVRARPGYLAPTEAEMASARVDGLMNGAPAGYSMSPGFTRALERLAPARGNAPFRVQAAAGPGRIWVTTELDAATLKSTEWQKGGRARVTFEHERGASAPVETEITLEVGQRTFSVTPPENAQLAPGRYVVRLQLTPTDGTIPLQTTVDVTVPDGNALISQTGLASRRGPSTGLQYQPTADARYRRTERLRLEIARLSQDGAVTARLLGRDGQPLPLAVTLSERASQDDQPRMIVADLVLAPMAQGEYVLEVTLEKDAKKESATYGFRVVP